MFFLKLMHIIMMMVIIKKENKEKLCFVSYRVGKMGSYNQGEQWRTIVNIAVTKNRDNFFL